MITLTNRLVQDDLYEILNIQNNPDFWTEGNFKNEWGIRVRNNDTTTTFYPYLSKEAAEKDYLELKRVKALLCTQ